MLPSEVRKMGMIYVFCAYFLGWICTDLYCVQTLHNVLSFAAGKELRIFLDDPQLQIMGSPSRERLTAKNTHTQTFCHICDRCHRFGDGRRAKVMQAAAGEGAGLEFDKDNSIAMAFVAAASNLRSRVFQVLFGICGFFFFLSSFFVAARDEV